MKQNIRNVIAAGIAAGFLGTGCASQPERGYAPSQEIKLPEYTKEQPIAVVDDNWGAGKIFLYSLRSGRENVYDLEVFHRSCFGELNENPYAILPRFRIEGKYYVFLDPEEDGTFKPVEYYAPDRSVIFKSIPECKGKA